MPTYYKILRNGKSCHGGVHAWTQGVTYEVDEVIACEKGFHACRLQDLATWLTYDMEIWEIELEEVIVEYNKVVGRIARLTKRLGGFAMDKQVEFARWCADRADEVVADASTIAAAHAANDAADAAAHAAHAADAAVDTTDAAASAVADHAAQAAADAAAHAAHAARAHAAAAAADAANVRGAQGRKILELLT